MRLILISMILIAASHHCFAQEIIQLKLKKLEAVQNQEQQGDELFFHITEFPEKSKPKHYYIPNRPAHWLSKHLDQVQNINLWQKSAQCENTEVLISLVEEDVEPWNINDLLGSVLLKVKCVDGKISKEWFIPDPNITMNSSMESNVFQFQGKKAKYKATFSLE